MSIVQASFDYGALDAETRIVVQQRTGEIKALMKRTASDIIEIGQRLIEVKTRLEHGQFGGWLEGEFGWSEWTARNFMRVAERFKTGNFTDLDFAPSALYLLAAPSTPEPARAEALERAEAGEPITHQKAKEIRERHTSNGKSETVADLPETEPPPIPRKRTKGFSVEEWEAIHPDARLTLRCEPAIMLEKKNYPRFNRTNDNIEWALWTWNPVTGCLHDCPYCYARDIANRFYPEKFRPSFHPHQLVAPENTPVPLAAEHNIGEKNVFVCSMADLFGNWVPKEWIESVLEQVRENPQWNFLFLTKFPKRLSEFSPYPANAWVGTSVDVQWRVANAEKYFRNVEAPVKWLSCEPLEERLTFSSLEMFDWVVIGGRSKSTQQPEFQPEWEWVEYLAMQARKAECMIYFKPNLKSRPREYPK